MTRRPVEGRKSARRVFGVEPRFDRVAAERDLLLPARQRFTRGDAKLPFDEVDAGHRLRHRMLDLKPRVHFDEEEAVRRERPRCVGDEFHRAGALIADRRRGSDRHLAERAAHFAGKPGCRRFLDHLLVPALHRAVALEEMHDVAVPVGEDLHLDVARRLDIALKQHLVVAEGGKRLALCAGERIVEVDDFGDAPHAAPAAAGDRLDQDRVADLIGLLLEEIGILPFAAVAGHDRHAGERHQTLGVGFRAHAADRRRWRPDEDQARGGRRFGEGGVLRKKAVARVDRLDTGRDRRRDDPLDR